MDGVGLPLLHPQLLSLRRDVEHIDGFMRLGVDQHHLDVASVGGNRRGQVVEQAGAVFGHNLHQRRGAAGLRVE